MKVLLLGASSYLGARLFFELQNEVDIVGTYSSHNMSAKLIPLDITLKDDVSSLIKSVKPDVIIHTANNANPIWCEQHPEEAVRVNQSSMKHIITAAKDVNSRLVYISSFSAEDNTTVYGRTKHFSEEALKQSGLGYLIIRPSLILGMSPNTTSDRSFNRMVKQLQNNTTVEYDIEWKFQPTYIKHVADVIRDSIRRGIYGYTIPVAVKDIKSRFEVCTDIFTPFDISVVPIHSSDHGIILTDDLEILTKLSLPEYTYEDMITNIISEIKQKETFVL